MSKERTLIVMSSMRREVKSDTCPSALSDQKSPGLKRPKNSVAEKLKIDLEAEN